MPRTVLRQQTRVPLISLPDNRAQTTDKDQRFVNCYVEAIKSPLADQASLFVTKRPGLSLFSAMTGVTGTTTEGLWYFKDYLYAVTDEGKLYQINLVTGIATELYSFPISAGAVSLSTLFGSAFELSFNWGAVEILAPTEKLFICNGISAVTIDQSGTVEEVEKSFNRWTASTYLKPGDKIIPTTYATQTAVFMVTGTVGLTYQTGASEPTWNTTAGTYTTSGDVTFICLGAYSGATQYTNRTYAVDDLVQPSVETGLYYKVTTGGTTLAEPTWPTVIGSTVTQNSVVFECMGYYGGFPVPHIPQPCFLDGYVFLCDYGYSDIYNSGVETPFSWNATEFISANSFTTPTKALARYNNYIMAFSEKDIELFYDAANETGSPLARHDSFLLQVGCRSQNAVVNAESIISWVGSSSLGGSSIWLMDGFEPKEISTPFINRLINQDTAPNTSRATSLRLDGHIFLLYNFTNANKTFVFDVGLGLWYEWTTQYDSTNIGYFRPIYVTQYRGSIYATGQSKEILKFDKTVYQDAFDSTNTYNINVEVRTPKFDFNNRYRKFLHSLDVIGDLESSNITLYWTDDDYQTWNSGYSLSMASRPRVMAGGSFRRRAFKIVHTDNDPMRLEGLELVFTQGSH